MPSSPATRLQSGSPAGSPQASIQVVNSNAGDWWYTAFSWLCCACRGGAVQDEPYHDDGEGQDVES